MKRIFYTILLILSYNSIIFSQESLESKITNYQKEKSIEWRYNPFRRYETDKYFNNWLNPESYIIGFWFGSILNANDVYRNKNFKTENVLLYFNTKLGTDLAPIAFNLEGDKHRFKIGVGYLAQLFFLNYTSGHDQLYGATMFSGMYTQVEAYFEYIFDNKFKIRFAPLRHICQHISGDILGDNTLYDKNIDGFRDVGYEQMHISAVYKWGWFSFYGGTSFAIRGNKISSIVNLFNIYTGFDVRIPIWGEISLITGVHAGAYYDELNDIGRKQAGDGYPNISSKREWTPSISVGIGFEFYRFTVGLKYEYARSKQLYAFREMESKIGLDASILF